MQKLFRLCHYLSYFMILFILDKGYMIVVVFGFGPFNAYLKIFSNKWLERISHVIQLWWVSLCKNKFSLEIVYVYVFFFVKIIINKKREKYY